MAFYKFKRGDILLNTLKASPEYNFFIYDRNRYINNKDVISGIYSSSVTNVPPGYVNLYELNVNRAPGNLIYPWMYAQQDSYLRISSMSSGSQKASASVSPPFAVTGSYPLSSSIQYHYFDGSVTSTKLKLESLRNTLNYYKDMSPHFTFNGSIPDTNANAWRTRNLNSEDTGMITIPAIIHGSGVKKGSVSLKFYVSGALQAELTDENQRGELIQKAAAISGLGSASVAGVVLYNEGVILLTGSWSLNTEHQENYLAAGNDVPKWKYFGSTMSGTAITTPSSSYILDFKSTEKIPTLTMLTYANRGELNYSNNPSFISASTNNTPLTGNMGYFERENRAIKNIVSSSYTQSTGSFEKITYITKVGIYDQYKNLIATAKMANPVRKREQDSYTFKLKLDM